MKKLAVVLMVKNEESIVQRCLSSILNLGPNLVIIADTGSKDSTVVRAGLFLQQYNIPYKIYFNPFKDFGTNRTELLRYARHEDIDYVLMIDADEVLEYESDFEAHEFKDRLVHDCYSVAMKVGNTRYFLPRITSNKKEFNYVGVTHEYLKDSNHAKFLSDVSINQINDSNRRLSGNKTKHDIQLLTKAISEIDDSALKSRYIFYLGQCYYEIKDFANAITCYNTRTQLGGWNEEVFFSYYQMGNIYSEMNPHNIEPILHNYLRAYEACPTRAESLYALKQALTKIGFENVANDIIGPKLSQITPPQTGLFIDISKYAS